jgi:co-chaperonin GroES (HSP10)
VDAVVVASVEGATTNSGTEIKMDNKEYLILREEEALGILEGKAATARGKK